MKKCRDCKYFEFRSYPDQEHLAPWERIDGWCRKIFPRGYVGAGKPGGKKRSVDRACFQFDEADVIELQLPMEEGDNR